MSNGSGNVRGSQTINGWHNFLLRHPRKYELSWSILMDHDRSWSVITDHDLSWSLMINYDQSWSIGMDHDASWSVMVNNDALWSIMIENVEILRKIEKQIRYINICRIWCRSRFWWLKASKYELKSLHDSEITTCWFDPMNRNAFSRRFQKT